MTESGFRSPVFDAQRAFRAVLTALSEPGRVTSFHSPCAPPAPMTATAGALALTLCDGDTPVWLSPSLADSARYLRFHTGAPIVSDPADASFVIAAAQERPDLSCLRGGDPEYPDRSATLILCVETCLAELGWRVSGPGVETTRAFLPQPIDHHFLAEWRINHARFPLGLDVIFAGRREIAALPRSARLEM